MTQEIRRRNEPLLVGGMYGQGTTHYLVTEHLEGFTLPTVHLRRQDGWELDAVGAALYDTPRGGGNPMGLQLKRAFCAADEEGVK